MRWESLLLGRRGRKAAALTLSMSLLNQQGLFVSEALAQVVTAPVKTTVRVAPTVVAPVTVSPTMAPLSLSVPLLNPNLTQPTLTLPSPASARGIVAVAAQPAQVQTAQAATVLPITLTLPSPASGRGERGKLGNQGNLEKGGELGGVREEGKKNSAAPVSERLRELSKGLKGDRVGALNLAFDGDRRTGTEAEPVAVQSKATPARSGLASAPKAQTAGRKFIEFNVQYLKDIKKLFTESATKPNKQDYMFLVTKTFGLNLAIRAAFAVKGVNGGDLTLERALISTAWYQIQDAVFTVFGQTYMKFLGKMTGMLRIGNAKLGDLLFVYAQLVGFEFLNRLVLGPIGENPLVYSASGLGLLFLNNLQGMASGGLIIPVINKLRAAGLISEKTSSYLYQAASLTMHLGLLATFGYQGLFTILTTALMVLSWTAYIGLSFFAKPKPGFEAKL